LSSRNRRAKSQAGGDAIKERAPRQEKPLALISS
jgi:hypothetical protein